MALWVTVPSGAINRMRSPPFAMEKLDAPFLATIAYPSAGRICVEAFVSSYPTKLDALMSNSRPFWFLSPHPRMSTGSGPGFHTSIHSPSG